MANDLSFNQVATILNSLQAQATGASAITATDTSSFVACATTTLKTGYDAVYQAIAAVLGRTIFSMRPYSAKLKGMEVSEPTFKLHTRKLQLSDNVWDDNAAVAWPATYDASHTSPDDPYGNGASIDMQKIKKAQPLQTNFYGLNTFQDNYTIFDEGQLEVAFSSPEEFAMFWTMVVQNVTDRLEQARENSARAILSNMAGACSALNDGGRVIHLLTEYNARTGKSLTTTTIYDPANYPDFVRWAFGRIAALSSLMSERSTMFQTTVTGHPIPRHTPIERQRLYIYAPEEMQMRANVLSTTFNEQFLRMADHEMVNFWQSISTPDSNNVKPGYMAASGAATVHGSAVTFSGLFGILMDEEAGGYARVRAKIEAAPHNAAGGYTNFWVKEYHKLYMDNTEKIILLVLD